MKHSRKATSDSNLHVPDNLEATAIHQMNYGILIMKN